MAEESPGFDFFAEASPSRGKYLVVVIYDISDDKRRNKLAKHLKKFGFRVQRSGFECRLSLPQYNELSRSVGAIVHAEDLIRIYKLSGSADVVVYGDKMYDIIDETVII